MIGALRLMEVGEFMDSIREGETENDVVARVVFGLEKAPAGKDWFGGSMPEMRNQSGEVIAGRGIEGKDIQEVEDELRRRGFTIDVAQRTSEDLRWIGQLLYNAHIGGCQSSYGRPRSGSVCIAGVAAIRKAGGR